MKLVLAYPHRRLNPNNRSMSIGGKHEENRLRKKQKKESWQVAKQEIANQTLQAWCKELQISDTNIHVQMTFHAATKRGRDRDNHIAMMKGALDGIALAIGVNDNRFIPSVEWGEVRRPACVIIELMEM